MKTFSVTREKTKYTIMIPGLFALGSLAFEVPQSFVSKQEYLQTGTKQDQGESISFAMVTRVKLCTD